MAVPRVSGWTMGRRKTKVRSLTAARHAVRFHYAVIIAMLGFETIGNATLIAYDGRAVLATDPWIAGDPYFGSWGMSHAIPEAQMAAIRGADYVWFSHGHPDHLNGDSLALLR